jgi:predicted DNA-binding protein
MYNGGTVLIENNNIGHLVLNILNYDIEYENIFNLKPERELGIRTTGRTKNIGAARLRELIENGGYDINDFNTVEEMSTFIYKKGKYQATSGSHDDIMMSLVIFAFFCTTDYFKELKDNYEYMNDILKNKKDELELDEIIVFDNGNDTITYNNQNEDDFFF